MYTNTNSINKEYVKALLKVLSNLNALLEYLTTLLEYIDLGGKE